MIVACLANYWIFIPSTIIIVVLVLFRHYFLYTSRNVQRLEAIGKLMQNDINFIFISTARSPLYSHISATIQGLSSIRAFDKENKVLNKFHFYQNEHTKAWYMKIVTSRWFGMRIDLIGSSFLMIIALSSIPLADSKYIHCNAYVAVCIVYTHLLF